MCISPIKVKYQDKYQSSRGVLIHPYNDGQVLPCGKCFVCRENNIEQWVIRWQEQLKVENPDTCYFLTLTYDDKHIPTMITPDGEEKTTLFYKDVQDFLKRLRKRQSKLFKENNQKITYHGCGEYGKRFTKRPHYHILMTGLLIDPNEIQSIWGNGRVHVGTDVNETSIKYILKYSLKTTTENAKVIKLYHVNKHDITYHPFSDEFTTSILKSERFRRTVELIHNCKLVSTTNKIQIDIKDKLIGKFYPLNTPNEYRVIEKSFCSKGIGKCYLTPEKIKYWQKNPTALFPYYDSKKNIIKPKPLPKYYANAIFNPLKRDENGKLIKDKYDRYIRVYEYGTELYEGSPRHIRQLAYYRKVKLQEKINNDYIMQYGLVNFMLQEKINRDIKIQKFERYKSQKQAWIYESAKKNNCLDIC